MRKDIIAVFLFAATSLHAKTVRSNFDLKFYEITTYDQPAQYLGFTSSKLDNFVSVPLGDGWFVRPDGHLDENGYDGLITELKERHFPGLDLSDRWDIKNKTLNRLPEIASLRVLKLSNTRITSSGLEVLNDLPKLKILSLNNQTTDAGLKHVRGLKQLKFLELKRAKITDGGLAVLKGLPQLEMLDVSDTHLTDIGAKTMAQILTLRQLDISGTDITDKGVGALAQLPKLETLYVSGHITNQGLKALARLKKLRNLDASGARITDAGLGALAGLKIEALALSGTLVGDDGLVDVAQIKSLKMLELSDTKMTPEGLVALADLPHLETLSVSWNELTDPELQALANLSHLKRVILNGRTLPPQVLTRVRAMAKLIKPQQPKAIAAVRHPIVVGMAPASHPASPSVLGQTQLLENRSLPSTKIHTTVPPSSRALPPDITATEPVKTKIGSDAPQGKGMEIEVGVASSRPGAPRPLTGLKRIYQAELLQRSHDGDVTPGESREINFPKETAENSLGEIEVGAGKHDKN